MKEIYEKPQTKIEEFKTVSVITTSGNTEPDTDIPWGQ